MKKLLLLTTAILLFCTPHYGQVDSLPVKKVDTNLAEQLRHKSNQERTAGYVLLGGGIALSAIAVAVYPNNFDVLDGGDDSRVVLSALLFVTGVAAVITSVPIFVKSGRNARKAKLLLNAERVELSPQLKTSQWQMKTGLAISF